MRCWSFKQTTVFISINSLLKLTNWFHLRPIVEIKFSFTTSPETLFLIFAAFSSSNQPLIRISTQFMQNCNVSKCPSKGSNRLERVAITCFIRFSLIIWLFSRKWLKNLQIIPFKMNRGTRSIATTCLESKQNNHSNQNDGSDLFN